MKEHGVDRMEDLKIDFAGVTLQQSEDHGNKVFDKHYASLWDTYTRQDDVQRAAAFASPMLAVRSLSMAMAGTEPDQNRDFATAAEAHRRLMIKTMNEDIAEHGKGPNQEYLAGDDVWAKVPDFRYDSPEFSSVAARRAPDLAILAAWFAASSILAVAAVSRVRAL